MTTFLDLGMHRCWCQPNVWMQLLLEPLIPNPKPCAPPVILDPKPETLDPEPET